MEDAGPTRRLQQPCLTMQQQPCLAMQQQVAMTCCLIASSSGMLAAGCKEGSKVVWNTGLVQAAIVSLTHSWMLLHSGEVHG